MKRDSGLSSWWPRLALARPCHDLGSLLVSGWGVTAAPQVQKCHLRPRAKAAPSAAAGPWLSVVLGCPWELQTGPQGTLTSLCLVPYRTEGHGSPGPEEAEGQDKGAGTPPPQILLPLEERVTHFRDMLLERGVRTASRRRLSPKPVTQ